MGPSAPGTRDSHSLDDGNKSKHKPSGRKYNLTKQAGVSMNRFQFKRMICGGAFSLLSGILLILVQLTGSAGAFEAPIINGKTKMAPGTQQTLFIWNYQTGNTYTWSMEAGGGSLSASTGKSVTYTAPTSNPNCAGNPTIQVIDSYGNTGSIQIAINVYTTSVTAFTALETTYRIPKAV